MIEPAPRSVLERVASVVIAALAIGLSLSIFAAAVHDASQAWDGFYYHLPFAARLGGLVPASELRFHPANEARFHGYPIFAELLQGLLWRVTGRAESANLVAFASVPVFALVLRRWLGVPRALTVLGLFAIPLVHEHATTSYVDLPANTCAAIVVVAALGALEQKKVERRALAGAFAAAAGAANMKLQLYPVIVVALGTVLAIAARERWSDGRRREVAIAAGALPLVFFTAVKNLVLHGNPAYPVRLALGPLALPGTEDAYGYAPEALRALPGPLRFFGSLLELGVRPFSSTRRWTVDQWMDGPGNRVGGFFHAYVVAMLVALVALVALASRTKSPRARASAIVMSGLTVVVALSPQSLELRYYMVWMIALVGVVLGLACAPEAPKAARAIVTSIVLAALATVLWVTGGGYAYPSGSTFRELVAAHTDARVIDAIGDGEVVCARKAPWSFVWAARFHAKRYVVQEAEEPEDCAGARELP